MLELIRKGYYMKVHNHKPNQKSHKISALNFDER